MPCYSSGLIIAQALGLKHAVVEGDSLEVINLLNDSSFMHPWNASCIIVDCKQLAKNLLNVFFVHARR